MMGTYISQRETNVHVGTNLDLSHIRSDEEKNEFKLKKLLKKTM